MNANTIALVAVLGIIFVALVIPLIYRNRAGAPMTFRLKIPLCDLQFSIGSSTQDDAHDTKASTDKLDKPKK